MNNGKYVTRKTKKTHVIVIFCIKSNEKIRMNISCFYKTLFSRFISSRLVVVSADSWVVCTLCGRRRALVNGPPNGMEDFCSLPVLIYCGAGNLLLHYTTHLSFNTKCLMI